MYYVLCTMYYVLYTIYCVLYTVYYVLYTIYCCNRFINNKLWQLWKGKLNFGLMTNEYYGIFAFAFRSSDRERRVRRIWRRRIRWWRWLWRWGLRRRWFRRRLLRWRPWPGWPGLGRLGVWWSGLWWARTLRRNRSGIRSSLWLWYSVKVLRSKCEKKIWLKNILSFVSQFVAYENGWAQGGGLGGFGLGGFGGGGGGYGGGGYGGGGGGYGGGGSGGYGGSQGY